MNAPVKPLPPEALYAACDPARLPFDTTDDLEPTTDVLGQDRAVAAVSFAIGMDHDGYNLFALGPEGTGKSSLVRRFVEAAAAKAPVPGDWSYIHNFDEPHRPKALELPAGRACPLRADMETLVEELRAAIPAAFESDEYRNRKSVLEEEFKERNESTFGALQKKAQSKNIALIRTPVGLALAPVREGNVLKPEEFEALPEAERKTLQGDMEALQEELGETLPKVPQWEKELREKLRELSREVTLYAVGFLIDELKKKWTDQPDVIAHLEAVHEDVVDNANEFLPQEAQVQAGPEAQMAALAQRAQRGPSFFRRYQVNVLVDNSASVDDAEARAAAPAMGAPVVEEDHPTQPNLIGRIEHIPQFGSLVTDFNLIKPGALHRANGGHLLLDARKLLIQPFVWESLKRALRSRTIRIESPGEEMGMATTISLQPEPIPLRVKVVLLGEPMIYYLLVRQDPDFRELFKVAADFDDRMVRDADNSLHLARLTAAMVRNDGLVPFDRGAVARIEEQAARQAADSERLSTHMGDIQDLLREADYWARQDGADRASADHVQKAVESKIYRSDRLRERTYEQIERQTVHIATDGAIAGQVNGLAVLQLDSFSFGKPSRISCRVHMGKGEVVDIERQVEMGGPLHSKGVLILSSYLSSQFSPDAPLSLTASLVFEQSYGGVDGDSASSTELYALLSALSDIPIKQSLAVTGSVDQYGTVQAIGGANEKIEGFFDICRKRGLGGEQGVLIPASNVKHLMLRTDVVAAAREGRFHIYPVATIGEGIELLTGVPAGVRGDDGTYPIGTVFRAVEHRLAAFTRKALALAAQARPRGGNGRGGNG